MTPDEIIKQWKSHPEKEVMLRICDSITQSYDLIGQILRTHLWAESLMNMTLFQVSKYSEKDTFAQKQKLLFDLGLIDETHYQELKILNKIRNIISHDLFPNEKILQEVKKLPSYDKTKTPAELEGLGLGGAEMGKFGWTTFLLLIYLLGVFWDPKLKNRKGL